MAVVSLKLLSRLLLVRHVAALGWQHNYDGRRAQLQWRRKLKLSLNGSADIRAV